MKLKSVIISLIFIVYIIGLIFFNRKIKTTKYTETTKKFCREKGWTQRGYLNRIYSTKYTETISRIYKNEDTVDDEDILEAEYLYVYKGVRGTVSRTGSVQDFPYMIELFFPGDSCDYVFTEFDKLISPFEAKIRKIYPFLMILRMLLAYLLL